MGSSTILHRTISQVVHKDLVLSESQFSRPFTWPSDPWIRVRLGIRYMFYTSETLRTRLTHGPVFAIGWTKSQTNLIGDFVLPDNNYFLGFLPTLWNSQYCYNCGSPSTGNARFAHVCDFNTVIGTRFLRQEGSTSTLHGAVAGYNSWVPVASSTSEIFYAMHLLDLTYVAGSPSYYAFSQTTIAGSTHPSIALTASLSREEFMYQMELLNPSLTNYTNTTTQNMPTLSWTPPTYINIAWDRSHWKLNISDIAISTFLN